MCMVYHIMTSARCHITVTLVGLLSVSMCVSLADNTIFHNEFAVHIPGGASNADLIANKYGYHNTGQIGALENFYLFQHKRIRKRSLQPALEHHKTLNEDPHVIWVEQQVEKKRVKRDFVDPEGPTMEEQETYSRTPRQFFQNPFGGGFSRFNFFSPSVRVSPIRRGSRRFPDPLYAHQWYLTEGASGGNDMNVVPAWTKGYTGKGVVVSILDDGIQHTHPDLRLNYDPQASTDINSNDADPMPRDNGDNKHGTRCAGEVASVAFNDICGVGVAYNASIGGVRMLDGTVNDAVEARAISLNPDHIDIYSASWGPEDDGKTVDGPGPLAKRAFINGVIRGRHGKGSIFVWASGNGGRHTDNCNCDGYTNSIFTLSISSASQRGFKPWYLEECSSTLATTYSSGTPGLDQSVATADMDGALRPDRICTIDHTGTSASAPLAAGLCALALEANPDLTWRDMQHIVVRTSRHEPLKNEDGWFKNAVGRYISHKFGYGLMDAAGMVDLASKWTTVAPQHVCQTVIQRSEQTIPTILGSSVTSEITTDGCAGTTGEVRYLEHVQAMVSLRFLPRGNINIKLISPSGTSTTVLFERPRDVLSEKFDDWPFLTVHFWGEKAAGTWKLIVTNGGSRPVKEPGVLLHWQLILHGTKDHPERLRFTPQASFSPNFNQFGDIVFSSSVNHESRLGPVNNVLNQSVRHKSQWKSNSTLALSKSEVCHSECLGGCHGPGPNNCQQCKHFSLQGECVHSCPVGTYGSEDKDCLPCHGSCSECIGPRQNQCSSCDQSLFVSHLGICVDTCPVGFFAEKGSCIPCSNQCAECNSTSHCLRCEHHLLFFNGTCHSVCQKGFHESSYYTCVPCDSSCSTCTGDRLDQCASCDNGLFLNNGRCIPNCPRGTFGDSETRQCHFCPLGCYTCDKEACTSCSSGWRSKFGRCVAYRVGNCRISEFADEQGICEACHSTCMNCFGSSETDCSHCQPDLSMYGNHCVQTCPRGWFKHRGRCLPCTPGCSDCESMNECNSCTSKYFFLNQQCVTACPHGYYNDRQTCLPCHPSCGSCWGPKSDQCLSCAHKMVLFQSSCRHRCPVNQYESNGTCLPCYHNCRTCNGSGLHSCTSCKDYLTLEAGMCLECRTGRYYNTTSRSCSTCHDSCLSCTDNSLNSCTSCQAPLSLHSATRTCRKCCSPNTQEQLNGHCCNCDIQTGKCFGAVTTDKRRIAVNPPLASYDKDDKTSLFGSTSSIIAAVILVNIFLFATIFSVLQMRSRSKAGYSYQRLASAQAKYSQHISMGPVEVADIESDEDTEYSVLYTKT